MATDHTPLDAPYTSNQAQKRRGVLRVFQILGWGIEGLSGLIILIGMFFKAESWEGGFELLIIGFSSLILLYLVLLWAITGSRSWLQGLLTLPVGLAMVLGISSVLFRWESWQGASEMAILGFLMLLVGLGVTLIFTMIRYQKSTNKPFYGHLLVRMVLATLITAPGFFNAF